MRLPNLKLDYQNRLFNEPLGNHGHVRTILGDFAESLTAKLLGGVRFKTDSRCEYCPDVRSGERYFEVKTVGASNHTFIYEGRLEKDLVFSADHELHYVLWHHDTDTSLCRDDFELRCWFLHCLKRIFIVPFETMNIIARESAVTKLNSRYGHSDTNETYGAGYRIPINRVIRNPHQTIEIQTIKELF